MEARNKLYYFALWRNVKIKKDLKKASSTESSRMMQLRKSQNATCLLVIFTTYEKRD